MTFTLLNPTPIRQTDANGLVAAGAKLYTYAAGTTTPQASYTDATGTTPLSNPVVADGTGLFPEIWLSPLAYDLACYTSTGTLLWTASGIAPTSTTSGYTPLSVTGTDTIVGTFSPGISSYVAGQQFQFQAAGNNTTTSVSINISGLGPQPIKHPDGTNLAAGDIKSGQLVQLYYTGTFFQFVNYAPQALLLSGGAMTGPIVLAANASADLQAIPRQQLKTSSAVSYSQLALSTTGVDSNVSITANELLLRASSGDAFLVSGVSVTINTANSGANGLDTGSIAGNTWYSVWVISDGTNIAGLISTSTTSPTMPGVYTYKMRVGWVRTDGTANKYPLSVKQFGNAVRYVVKSGSNVATLRLMASGTVGDITAPTWVAVSVSPYVCPTASSILITGMSNSSGTLMVAPSNQYGAYNSITNPPPFQFGASTGVTPSNAVTELFLESTNIYWANNDGAVMFCNGWRDNI